MHHVVLQSRRLRVIVRALTWLVPLGWGVLLAAAVRSGEVHLPGGSRPMSELSVSTHAAVMLLGSLHVAVLWLILKALERLLSLYASGLVFVSEATLHYHRLGHLLIAFTATDAVSSALLGPVLWLLEGLDEVPMPVEINLPVLLIGLAVTLLSRIMHEACRISEENSLTI